MEMEHLRDLQAHPGWKTLCRLSNKLTEDCQVRLVNADDVDQWREARGFLSGHLRTRQLLEVLVSQAQIGDEKWVQAQVNRMAGRERERVPERARRVMELVAREQGMVEQDQE
jgi:hypothetical protein